MSDMTGGRTRRDQLRVRLEQERVVEISRLEHLHAPGPGHSHDSTGPADVARRTRGPRSAFGPSMVRGEQRLAHIARALARIDDEDFGRCHECGSLIDGERLARQPLLDDCWRCAGP